ncbi:hypothetical protein DVH24_002487 [Malus domestica]|uniref:Uncharacterized protein n=1 Tax=Malus domestica TaxID=3750 RepID=A0A498IQB9_MALDO|nr:hypothetical protein DVH24_002487 [Malus domestica]
MVKSTIGGGFELGMSHLIRTRRPMTSTPSPTTIPTTATTALTEMDHRPVNPIHSDGPPVPQA